MTKINIIFCFLIFSLGCKQEDIAGYTGGNNIYFQTTSTISADSLFIQFAYAPNVSITDSVVQLVVKASGVVSNEDRPYVLSYDATKSNAKEGVDFILPPASDLIMKAGKMTDTLSFIVKKSPETAKSTLLLYLTLQGNSYFGAGFNPFPIGVASSAQLPGDRFKIKFDDLSPMPSFWPTYEVYFGTFSRKKIRFMLFVTEINDLTNLQTFLRFGEAVNIALYTQDELDRLADEGQPVYEEDGSLMKMGRLIAP